MTRNPMAPFYMHNAMSQIAGLSSTPQPPRKIERKNSAEPSTSTLRILFYFLKKKKKRNQLSLTRLLLPTFKQEMIQTILNKY